MGQTPDGLPMLQAHILALKEVVGPGHQHRQTYWEDASIVIAYYVPFTTELAETNVEYGRLASPEWAWPTETNACLAISTLTS